MDPTYADAPARGYGGFRILRNRAPQKIPSRNNFPARMSSKMPRPDFASHDEETVPGPRSPLLVREVSRVLLHLPRNRGHAARHRAARASFRRELRGGRGALHEGRREKDDPDDAPSQGP